MLGCLVIILCLTSPVDGLEPAVIWKVETAAMPHGPTLFPDECEPRGIVLGAGTEVLLVDGAGAVEWQYACDAPTASSVTVADLDNNGLPESVVVLTDGTLLCLDAAGEEHWRQAAGARAGVYNMVVAADVHPAPGLELVFGLDDGRLRCTGSDGELLWSFLGDRFRVGVPAVGDVDGDGAAEIIYGTDNDNVYCLSGLGEVKWRYTEEEGPFGRSGANIADLDCDGRAEILLTRSNTGVDRCLLALDGVTGALRWQSPAMMQGYVSNAISDLDGDGQFEALHADKGNWLYCVNADGSERWRTELSGRGIFWAPAVGNLVGDGAAEILVCVRDTDPKARANAFMLDASGVVLASLSLAGNANAAPVLADLSRDGRLEAIVCTSGPNGVQALQWPGPAAGQTPAVPQWPSLRGDSAMHACTNVPFGGPAEKSRHKRVQSLRVDIDEAFFGANVLRVSWGTPAPKNAFMVMDVRSADAPDEIAVTPVPPGATAAELSWRLATARATVSLTLNASGATASLGRWEGRVRAEPLHASGLAKVKTLCERALVAGIRCSADTRGLKQRLAMLEAEEAMLRRVPVRRGRPNRATIARAEVLRRGVAELGRITAALEKSWSQGDVGSFVVWQDANPWDAFDPHAMPDALERSPSIHVSAYGNEQEDIALNLLNVSDHAVDVRCVFEKPRLDGSRPQGEPMLARHVTLRRTVRVPSDRSGMVPDALPELDLSRTITLPPFETQQLWLVVDTHGLEPGTHLLTLYIGSLEAQTTIREVPLIIEVSTVALPEGVYAQMNWVGIDVEQTSDQQLRDMLEHGVTVAYGPVLPAVPVDATGQLAGPVDWSRCDAGLARVPGYVQVLWPAPPPVRWPKGVSITEDDPLYTAGFATALRTLVAHLQEMSVGYDRWGLYPFDEPWLTGFTVVPLLKRFCERVKAIDPDVRIYADPAGLVRAEYLDEFKNLVDIWQPEMNLLKRDPELVRWFQENARTLWAYEAADPGKDLLPLGYYRAFAWLAWLYKLDGAGFWVYKHGDLYWPLESANWEAVYPTNEAVVPSRRWEAVRDGQEDYRLLYALREQIARVRAAGHAEAAEEAQRLIDEAVERIVGWQARSIDEITRQTREYEIDFALLTEYRAKIGDMIVRLRAM